jgi:membrane-associated phospholipid phosphatase
MFLVKKGSILSIILAIILATISLLMGKENLFLALNFDGGFIVDTLAIFFTFLGNGVLWLLLILLVYLLYKKHTMLTIYCLVTSTIIAQSIKIFILPNCPRPSLAMPNTQLYHTVLGVDLHKMGSFPSGHTTQAFTFFLLICYIIPQKKYFYFWLIIALFIGYSRVYLAQHFPIDVAGGILAAVASFWISYSIQQKTKPSTT